MKRNCDTGTDSSQGRDKLRREEALWKFLLNLRNNSDVEVKLDSPDLGRVEFRLGRRKVEVPETPEGAQIVGEAVPSAEKGFPSVVPKSPPVIPVSEELRDLEGEMLKGLKLKEGKDVGRGAAKHKD